MGIIIFAQKRSKISIAEFGIEHVLETTTKRLMENSRNLYKIVQLNKYPKLRTYKQFKIIGLVLIHIFKLSTRSELESER